MNNTEQKLAKDEALKVRRSGGTLSDAAAMAGVDRTTLFRWRKEDETFATNLRQVRRIYKISLIRKTREKRPWFLLERQFPNEFGQRLESKVVIHSSGDNTDLAERVFNILKWVKLDSLSESGKKLLKKDQSLQKNPLFD